MNPPLFSPASRNSSLPGHHPSSDMLLDYAAGKLTPGAALVVATHLVLCPNCRQYVWLLEAVGGAMLVESEPMPVSSACLEAVLAQLDGGHGTAFSPSPQASGQSGLASRFLAMTAVLEAPAPGDCLLPRPLHRYLSAPPDPAPWETLSLGVESLHLNCPGLDENGLRQPRLIRVTTGATLPAELLAAPSVMIVLTGQCEHAGNRYTRGDILMQHTPETFLPVKGREDTLLLWTDGMVL